MYALAAREREGEREGHSERIAGTHCALSCCWRETDIERLV